MQLRADELATGQPSPATTTTTTTANTILARIARAQAQVVELTEDLPEATLRWHIGPHAPAMRFHLWHLARWADKLQSSLTGLTVDLRQRLEPTTELWATESLAARW